MKKKSILYIVIVIILFGGLYLAFAKSSEKGIAPTPQPEPKGQLEGTVVSPEQNNPVNPSPSAPVESAKPAYTLAQVSTHNSATSCWTVVRTNVYDLTPWIKQHPGGANAILSLCGRDGTTDFEKVHGGKTRQENVLAGFEIGTYQQ